MSERPSPRWWTVRPAHSRREFLRLALGVATCSAAVPVFAACGSDPLDISTAKSKELLGSLPSLRDPAAPRQARSGTLRLGATPEDLAAAILPLVSGQLCVVDPRSGEVYGDLAERVEFAGELRLAFTLREDARFHPDPRGLAEALTADSVVRDFSNRRNAREFLFTDVVTKVEAPDLRTVILEMRAPYATLFEGLADPALAAIRGQGRYEALDLPLGAGPFIPAAADESTVLLGANQLYHRPGLPLLEAINIAVRGDQATLDSVAASGGFDVHRIAESADPPRGLDMRRATRPSRGMFGLALSAAAAQRGDRPAGLSVFAEERVRRAVSLSIDREAILNEFHAVVSGPVGPAFAADALPTDELTNHTIYRRQPQAAAGLLEAAGSSELAFSMLAPDTTEARALLANLQRQTTEAGLRMRLVLASTMEWENAIRTGDFEAVLFDSPDLHTPDAGLRLHTSAGLEGAFSPWGFSNPVYDAAVRTALTALAPHERGERARQAQRVLLDSVPALLPIGTRLEEAWISNAVQGYEWEASTLNDRWFAATWRINDAARRGAGVSMRVPLPILGAS